MIIERRCRQLLYRELIDDEYYLRRLPKGIVSNFIDIGANVGLISIFMRLLNPRAKILAIEPHPETYKSLVDNVSNLDITTKQVALGNGQIFHLFKERKTNLCNAFTDVKTDENCDIQSETLPSIIKSIGYDPLDLYIKIDCEGAEQYLLEDKETCDLLPTLKFFIVEAHNKNNVNPSEFYSKIHRLMHYTHVETSICHSDRTINLIYIRKDIYGQI